MNDTLPPHDVLAESALLGSVLHDPLNALVTCIERIKTPDVFYVNSNRTLYVAITTLYARKTPVTLVTLQALLRDIGELDNIGGLSAIAAHQDSVPGPDLLDFYLRIVLEKHQLRAAVRIAQNVISAASGDHPGGVEKFLDEAQARILSIERHATQAIWEPKALVLKATEAIERAIKALGIVEMATGFSYWDRLSGGLHRGELVLIAGRPGTGKTSLAMNVAERMAIEGRKAVGVLSLEMTAESLMIRSMCARARVNFHKLRSGFRSHGDVEKLSIAGLKLAAAGLYIDDTPRLGLLQIRAKLRQMKHRFNISVAVIDYVQLVVSPPGLEENRVQALAEISAGLKAAAKELEIPVIAISQLSRESEKRGGRPKMSDLRDSGALEQDADFIGILFRKELPEEEEAALREQIREDPCGETVVPVIMEVVKQRNGPTGDVHFDFHRAFMRFEDLQRPSKPDVVEELL